MIKTSLLLLTLLLSLLNFSLLASDETQKTLHIQLPKTPDVPTVNTNVIKATKIVTDGIVNEEVYTPEQTYKHINNPVGFSKRIPPNYNDNELIISNEYNITSDTTAAFLETKVMPLEEIKQKLQESQFQILSEYTLDEKENIVSIVFTNRQIISHASKPNRGFAGNLRILVNNTSGKMSITNPIYILKAFMQEEYDTKIAITTLNSLQKTFSGLKNSQDSVKSSKLIHYRYMDNMPYYQDMEVIAHGSNSNLINAARNSKKLVFEQQLENGSTIIGVKLSPRTSKFAKKIGYQNGGLLPYPILIENNKAKILAPQYYIALMYPMLSMTNFMSIASIPGAINKECMKVFR